MTERCAIHPDRAAEITCSRCGSFACFECVGPTSAGICARCRLRVGGGSDRVGQLRICAILTISHGILMTLFGTMYVALGLLLGLMPPPSSSAEPPPPPELMVGMMSCFGLVNVLPGVLQIMGGLGMLRRRGRTFAMIALGSGIISMFGCYCFATSLALAVWGFILLSDAEVRAAFEASDQPA